MNGDKEPQRVAGEAGDLLSKVAAGASQSIGVARDSIKDGYEVAKEAVADAQAAVVDKGAVAVKATGRYVEQNPWFAVGIAAAIGLAIGMLMRRR